MANNKGQQEDSRGFIGGFIVAIIALLVTVELLPTLEASTSALGTTFAFVANIVPIVAGAGIVLFAVRALNIA